MNRIFVTGHRPDKLGGYDPKAFDRLVSVAIQSLRQVNPTVVTTGMALGWDQAVAVACLQLSIPFVAAIPFRGQECKWNAYAQQEYKNLVKQAAHVHICSPGDYRPQKMIIRNHWMVDNNDAGLALWNGDHNGGTFECVQYALINSKEMHNAWELFTRSKDYVTRLTKV